MIARAIEVDPTIAGMASRVLILVAINLALNEFNRLAIETDTPSPCDVEAADLLEAARDLLAREPSGAA